MTTPTAQNPALMFQRTATVQISLTPSEVLTLQCGAAGFGFDVDFKVKRGVKVTPAANKPHPNTCELKLWGLNPSHRKALQQTYQPGKTNPVIPVVISAGYLTRRSVIFSGELRAGNNVTDGADVVTELSTGDGDKALTQQRLTIALGPGSQATQGLQTILTGLGIGQGNLQKAITLLQAQPLAATLFSKGVVLKGSAADLMTDFCRTAGLDWSVQNGALQITALNQPLAGQAVLIDENHGMIGSPTVDTQGILTVKTEMIPDVFPGVLLSVQSVSVTGGYKVIAVETRGSTKSDEWGHTIQATIY